jgi:hypothetical protein
MISFKLALFAAFFAIAFTVIAAHPIEEAESFDEDFLDLDQATDLEQTTDLEDVTDLEDASDSENATNMNIFLSVDNSFELFVDGKKVCSGDNWQKTYQCQTTILPGDVIALDGRDAGGPAAFIGVFNGVPTKPSDWRCKDTTSPGEGWNRNSFDDASWPQAVGYSRNDANNIWRRVGGGPRPNIPGDAQWLWTKNNENHDRVFCRYVPIKAAPVSDVRSLNAALLLFANYSNRLLSVPAMLLRLKMEITKLSFLK